MITVTETANSKIEQLLVDSAEPYLRISVKGGGCSGFTYVFNFDETKEEDDWELGKILVDVMSMQYLQGATVDYVEELMGASFKVTNPNAANTCGCGSSFTV
jgi:iron-sulfur cluster assembly accessory protein